ncbi:MAG TPA: hypothetical protein VGG04_11565 [Candidatus Sulfotelmatobacter sp.]
MGFRLLICLLFLSAPCIAQNVPLPQPPVHEIGPPTDEDDARARITHDMEKKANKERVAALKSDTDKLLKLSVELKAYVDKSDENVLSLDVMKKAAEIEKLAHSVKEKMKGPN